MKLGAAIFLVFAMISSAWGQELKDSELYERTEFTKHVIFDDSVYVISSPTKRNAILDTLYIGDEILLLRNLPSDSIGNGILAQWVEIMYRKGDEYKHGVVWGGTLSLSHLNYGVVSFVYGVSRVTMRDTLFRNEKFTVKEYHAELKAIRNNKLSAVDSFIVTDSGPYHGTELEYHLLDNILCVPSITFSGAACGIPALTFKHLWNGNRLIRLPVLRYVIDAGSYVHAEEYVFPDNKEGKKNMIVWKMQESEVIGINRKGTEIEKTRTVKKVYKWDGNRIYP